VEDTKASEYDAATISKQSVECGGIRFLRNFDDNLTTFRTTNSGNSLS